MLSVLIPVTAQLPTHLVWKTKTSHYPKCLIFFSTKTVMTMVVGTELELALNENLKRRCPSEPSSSGSQSPLTLIEKINQCIMQDKTFFSLEFFPPRTPAGASNLIGRVER